MGAAGHGLFCHLWAVRTCSNRRCALIGLWVTLSTTGSIKIKRGDEKTEQSTTTGVAAIVVAVATATATAMAMAAAATAMAKALEMKMKKAEKAVAAAPE